MEDDLIYIDDLNEQSGGGTIVFAPQNGKPGYRVKKPDGTLGQWIEVDKSQLNSPGLKADLDRYIKAGGQVYTPPASAPAPSSSPSPSPSPSPAQGNGSGGGGNGGGSVARPPAPPQQSPVAQYMAAAAAARKSGDPVQMAKVRDQGMAIWRAKYADTLAKKVDFKSRPTGRQIGTGESQMAKDAAELKAIKPAGTPGPDMGAAKPLEKVQAVSQPAATSLNTQAQQRGVKPLDTAKLERSRVRGTASQMVSASYEPYDLVLGYLISEGHADTIEEANYIMMQMDAEYVQSIVEKFPDVKGTLNPWESPTTGKSGVKLVTDPKTGKPVEIRNPLYKGV